MKAHNKHYLESQSKQIMNQMERSIFVVKGGLPRGGI